jgi:large subunit ribosomal protein L16
MLQPKKTKYRKSQKGGKNIKGNSTRGNTISFGTFALKAVESGRINSRQIESARKVITRSMKRAGKLWIRVFPHTPVTKKPAEVRMGKGKGSIDHYIFKIKPGRIIFELDGIDSTVAESCLIKAASKIPFGVKFITLI